MSKELNKTYDPKDIEDRLYKKWEDNGYFHAEVDRSKKPFTIVMPPPNITGQLHMGHYHKICTFHSVPQTSRDTKLSQQCNKAKTKCNIFRQRN